MESKIKSFFIKEFAFKIRVKLTEQIEEVNNLFACVKIGRLKKTSELFKGHLLKSF
jgi:hypothetical protein